MFVSSTGRSKRKIQKAGCQMTTKENFRRQLSESFSVADLIKVVEMGGFRGGCCGTRGIPNCAAMSDLGVILLTEDNADDHKAVEDYFCDTLRERKPFELTFIALCFMKNERACLSNEAKSVVAEYEADPANSEVVQVVNHRLAAD